MQVTNTIAFGFSLLGTSVVIRRLGLRRTLLTYPAMCLVVAVAMMLFPYLYVSVGGPWLYFRIFFVFASCPACFLPPRVLGTAPQVASCCWSREQNIES